MHSRGNWSDTSERIYHRNDSIPIIVKQYMERPRKLEQLTLSQCFTWYEVKTFRSIRKTPLPKSCNSSTQLLRLHSFQSSENPQKGSLPSSHAIPDLPPTPLCAAEAAAGTPPVPHLRFAVPRKQGGNNWSVSHIMNVPLKLAENQNSPQLWASAVLLHVSFRSTQNLLLSQALTERLRAFLQDTTEIYDDFYAYINRLTAIGATTNFPSKDFLTPHEEHSGM